MIRLMIHNQPPAVRVREWIGLREAVPGSALLLTEGHKEDLADCMAA